jgi:poly-gamma-glutamate synthesis protein (capsule biosynthesis protein)
MFHRSPLIFSFLLLITVFIWACFTVTAKEVPASEALAYLSPATTTNYATTQLPTPTSVTITFVGDIMLAREVEKAIIKNGVDYPFATIKDQWADSDLVIGNFEDTVRDTYRYEGEVLAFDTQPANIIGLKNAGFTHLSLANNHGDDFGPAVTAATRQAILDLGLTPFGDPIESQLHITHIEKNGLKLSLIGFHAFLEDPQTIATAITTEKAAGNFVIVLPHWGNEYQIEPSPAQVNAAQLFVDAGADLIVGGHPHIIEPIKTVSDTPVAYSLGNFIFDQDWSVATTQGMMLQITVDATNITITPIAISIKNRQAILGTFPVPSTQTWLRH